MKISTWNVNSLRVRIEHVCEWLQLNQPDVLALQELKITNDLFPYDQIAASGYKAVANGQKTYNGVAILSREEPSDLVNDLPNFEDQQRRVLAATIGDYRVVNLYVPNGQTVGSDKYDYKLNWLEALHDFLQQQISEFPNLVVVGDFNIAPDDRDVHDPEGWMGNVLVSEKERNALKKILDLGMVDTFRQFEQADNIFSWWDYRAGAFRRNRGLRIDLVLASKDLAEKCLSCDVDIEPRTLERPSDHAPVSAVFGAKPRI
ncbi:MAG: exodeoxyribonuclease III [Gammaproteobacteria bacterium]|nr:exodeoxyribonuclease III [Gammaproteobacteria bacterium]MCZ6717425.1 exodeoxyribonuclease III [Gammaproteobacteria bacterium]